MLPVVVGIGVIGYVAKKVFLEEKYAFALYGNSGAGKTVINDLLLNDTLKEKTIDNYLFDSFSILDVKGKRTSHEEIDKFLGENEKRRCRVIYVFDASKINDENWEDFKMRVDSVARWYKSEHKAKCKLIGTRDGALKPEQKERLNDEFRDGIKLVEFFPKGKFLSKDEQENLRDEIIKFIKR